MTFEEMLTHRVSAEGFWAVERMHGADGYDMMEPAKSCRWTPISGWGRDGWDLGSWPYVVVYWRTLEPGVYELATWCEGDVDCYRFATADARIEATDCIAFFYWHSAGEEWVEGIESADQAPSWLRGQYSRSREMSRTSRPAETRVHLTRTKRDPLIG